MDWKLLLSTFLVVFVAELGDKTQLAVLSLAASGSSRWVVFGGSALALVASSAIAVLLGEGVSRVAMGDRVATIFAQRWLSGEPTEAKRWLAASLDKTIKLQMDPAAEMRALSALAGPDWIER